MRDTLYVIEIRLKHDSVSRINRVDARERKTRWTERERERERTWVSSGVTLDVIVKAHTMPGRRLLHPPSRPSGTPVSTRDSLARYRTNIGFQWSECHRLSVILLLSKGHVISCRKNSIYFSLFYKQFWISREWRRKLYMEFCREL